VYYTALTIAPCRKREGLIYVTHKLRLLSTGGEA